MQDPSTNNIQKFVSPAQIPRKEAVSYSEQYLGKFYQVPPEQTSIPEALQAPIVKTEQPNRSKAAQHTAYLQSKINALRTSPLQEVTQPLPTHESNAAAQTAFLQQKINQARGK